MKIELIETINLNNKLVNSIFVIGDFVYYASALGNCIYKYNLLTKEEFSVVDGGCGYGKYKFREPVHLFVYETSDGTNLLVSDWHNHRVVKYRNGQYVTELGIYSPTNSFVKNILKFTRGLSSSGQYLVSHFAGSNEKYQVKTSLSENLIYLITSSFGLLSKRFFPFNKPNGACFYKNGVIFTQKNSNCLTFSDLNLNPLGNYKTPELGRLGNVNSSFGKVVFCIESIGKVYSFNDSGFEEIKINHIDTEFKPFSAEYISKRLIAIISMSNFHIFDTVSGNEVLRQTFSGELHGLQVIGDKIYVSDRLESKIHVMRLNND